MYVKVRVYAGMKKDSLTKLKENYFEIITRAPAQGNAANQRVRELIAVEYGVTEKAVRLVSGYHHPSKILEVIKEVTT
jgi:uncharacterized protein YggU (UPF0235/DUF167 family)